MDTEFYWFPYMGTLELTPMQSCSPRSAISLVFRITLAVVIRALLRYWEKEVEISVTHKVQEALREGRTAILEVLTQSLLALKTSRSLNIHLQHQVKCTKAATKADTRQWIERR